MDLRVEAVLIRVLLFSLLILPLLSTTASAEDVSGTWEGTVTQTHYDPSNNLVTIHGTATLSISGSGNDISGTLSMIVNGQTKNYAVDGSTSGSTLMINVQFGWDGVSYCDCTITFQVSGNHMKGSGSFLNVGETINMSYSLDRSGGVATTALAVGAISAGALGIITALLPLPKPGFLPGQAPPTPCWVGETPYGGDFPKVGMSLGGVGLHEGPPINAPRWGRSDPAPRPSDWYRERNDNCTPECPHCQARGITQYLRPILKYHNDPGIWMCDRCGQPPWQYGGP